MKRTLEQIVFEVTYKCDLKCQFCYNVWKGEGYHKEAELSLEQYAHIAKKLPNADLYVISGGEPLLRKDVFEIADIFQSKCKAVSLLTSGVGINEEIAKRMSERNMRIQLPVHGLKEKHDEFTGRSGTFQKLIEAFSRLKEHSALYSTSTVLSKMNVDYLEDILEFCVAMGSRYLLLIRFLPGGAGLERRDLLLNRDEIRRSYEILDKVCGYYGVKGGVGIPNLPCVIDEKQFKNIEFSSCSAGKSWFVIDPSGGLRICNHSPVVYGNILKNDLEDILKNETLRKFSQNKIFPKECSNCDRVDSCRGGCRAVAETMYGDLYGPDPLYTAGQQSLWCYSPNITLSSEHNLMR